MEKLRNKEINFEEGKWSLGSYRQTLDSWFLFDRASSIR